MKIINYLILLFIGFSSCSVLAQIEVPNIIANGVVLQREEVLLLSGNAKEHQNITLTFDENEFETKADAMGKWEFEIPPQPAGGPHKILFLTETDTLERNDVYFGDVWLCSGQSNMETTMERVSPLYPEEIQNSKNEKIRQFLVVDDFNFKAPLQNIKEGSWMAATPENLPEFSAVAYFFAKKVHQETNVPIGLINSAVGGSPIEAWMNEKSLKRFPDRYKEHLKYRSDSLINAIKEANRVNSERWNEKLTKSDKGIQQQYHKQSNFSDWRSADIPGYWQENGMLDSAGVIWYKKEFQLSQAPFSEVAQLILGRLIDRDQVYVNGQLIGQTGYQYPPRRYSFDSNLLKRGKNVITVRLVNNGGQAGFVEDKPYYLQVDEDFLNLKGTWNYKVGAIMPTMKGHRFIHWKPGGLYNAMIAPLHDFKIKGILWYQGESNAGNPTMYEKLFPELIAGWRAQWNNENLPFLYVQLPNFMKPQPKPGESNWAEMREIQRRLNDSLPNTGMAVTIDIGEWNDIHPLNKKDVGERLAGQAFEKVYGKELLANSPEPESWEVHDNEVLLHFKAVGEGLYLKRGRTPQEFAVSADGEHYYWARAKLVNKNTITLYSSAVTNPRFVRYAWADNPDKAMLYNSADLPASPFEIKLD